MELKRKTSKEVAKRMKRVVARYTIPVNMRTDNGPCYVREEYRNLIEEWKVRHVMSSPLHPQSNGLVKRAVGSGAREAI